MSALKAGGPTSPQPLRPPLKPGVSGAGQLRPIVNAPQTQLQPLHRPQQTQQTPQQQTSTPTKVNTTQQPMTPKPVSTSVTSPKPTPTDRIKSSPTPVVAAMSPSNHQHHQQSKDPKSPSSASASSTPKSTRTNLLEARSEQNKGKELPLNVKMMLQKRPEMWAAPEFAHNYPVEVWEHYDVNKDGILNKSELLALAKDLVDRIVSMCKDGLRLQMPKSSDADLEKLIKKELPHILPAKTVEESRRIMAEHIFRELDRDKDGVITRTEFFFHWQGCSQKVLEVNKTKQEALSCTIL